MQPLRDLSRLRPGDVIIHPARGGAVIDVIADHGAWVQLAERLDRSEAFLSLQELQDGWAQAMPGGLFEHSVTHPEQAMATTQDEPGASLHALCEELDRAVDRETAATWLVSRGLLPPGRTVSWWAEAREQARTHPGLEADGDQLRAVPTSAPPPDDVGPLLDWLAEASPRVRFDHLQTAGEELRGALLDEALDRGDADLAASLCRWCSTDVPHRADALDRLLSSGHRGLLRRLAQLKPRLAAPALLADARIHTTDGLAGDLLGSMPARSRDALLVEILAGSLRDPEALDTAELLIDTFGGMGTLLERFEPLGDQPPELRPPTDGRWKDALTWLRGRGADSTMEMPSLHPTPLLRDAGRVAARDAFLVAIAVARALARRHAAGRCGGVRGARLHRAEWRVDLGPAELGTPDEDVRTAMRTCAELLIGRVPPPRDLDDGALIAHLRGLVPDLSPDWLGVFSRAMDAAEDRSPTDGLGLWTALVQAEATSQVRSQAPVRRACRVALGHDTHIGATKSRLGQTNQDALFWHQHGPLTVALVADGISISSAGTGNLASALLVQAVASLWEDEADLLVDAADDRIEQFLTDALSSGNTSVCEHALRLAGGDLRRHVPMGTTAVMAVLRDGKAWIASVGDSRVYLDGESGLALLTGDGNLRGDRLAGHQAGEPLDIEGDGAALTAYVGHYDEHDRPDPVPPQLRRLAMLPGEQLLLCTDGLTDFASDSANALARDLAPALSDPSVDRACRRLTDLANDGGGGDNITVMIARVLD